MNGTSQAQGEELATPRTHGPTSRQMDDWYLSRHEGKVWLTHSLKSIFLGAPDLGDHYSNLPQSILTKVAGQVEVHPREVSFEFDASSLQVGCLTHFSETCALEDRTCPSKVGSSLILESR